jgi:hypothetical protein
MIYIYIIQRNIKLRNLLTIVSPIPGDLKLSTRACYSRLLILFCFVSSEMAETFHTNSKNKTEQFSSHFKSRSILIFRINFDRNVPVSFHMFCSGLEKPLNQIGILFKLNYFKLKFYLILTI